MNNKIFKIIILCVLAALFMQFFQYAVFMLRYPYEWDHTEGMVLFAAERLFSGEALYKNPCTYPMVPVIYPPFYMFIVSFLFRVTGVSLLAGRLLSVSAAFLSGLILYVIVRRKTLSVYSGVIACLFFFANNRLSYWFALFRVDMLMVFLSLAGIFVISNTDNIRKRHFLTSAVFLCAAFYAKQTAVFAYFAVLIYLIIKNRKAAFRFSAVYFMLLSMIFLYLNRTGGAFFQNVIIYNRIGYNFGFFLKTFGEFFILLSVMFLAAFIRLFTALKYKKVDIWDIYFLCSFISAFAVGSPGAGPNHFIMLFSSLCIVFVLWLYEFRLFLQQRIGFMFSDIAVCIIMCFQLLLFFMVPSSALLPELRVPDISRNADILGTLDDYVFSRKGPVLLNMDLSLAINNGKEVFFFGPPYALLTDIAGRDIDLSLLKQDIEAEKFDALILCEPFVPRVLRQAIKENYSLALKVPVQAYDGMLFYYIYEPENY